MDNGGYTILLATNHDYLRWSFWQVSITNKMCILLNKILHSFLLGLKSWLTCNLLVSTWCWISAVTSFCQYTTAREQCTFLFLTLPGFHTLEQQTLVITSCLQIGPIPPNMIHCWSPTMYLCSLLLRSWPSIKSPLLSVP